MKQAIINFLGSILIGLLSYLFLFSVSYNIVEKNGPWIGLVHAITLNSSLLIIVIALHLRKKP